jgi:hypothetical protein
MAADCAAAPAVRSKSTAAVSATTTATATATATVSARTGDTARRERYSKRDRCDLQAASGSSSVITLPWRRRSTEFAQVKYYAPNIKVR